MITHDADFFTQEEFLARFRLALSYYDHYVTYSSFMRARDHSAEKALRRSGLTINTKPRLLVRSLMSAWNEPTDETQVTKTMEAAWKHYITQASHT
jgi:hypothetical protein